MHNNSGNPGSGGGGGGRIPHSNNSSVTGGGIFDGISSPTSDINKADYQSSPSTGKYNTQINTFD